MKQLLPTLILGVFLLFTVLSVSATSLDSADTALDSEATLAVTENLVIPPQEQTHYIISYSQKNIQEVQQRLQDALLVERYIPDHKYVVFASLDQLRALQNEGLIISYELYPVASETILPYASTTTYILHLFPTTDKQALLNHLAALHISFTDKASTVVIIPANQNTLTALHSLRDVEYVTTDMEFAIQNDLSNTVSGTNEVRQRLGLYGAGQIIAVADTGLDTGINDNSMHADIRGRIISLTDFGGYLPISFDKNGHGTHTTASVLGNGILSGSTPLQHKYSGSYAGAAPEAKVVFQSLGDAQGTLGIYPPYPLSTIYFAAYQQGARVHSNSWSSIGAAFFGIYDYWAQETDMAVATDKDLVITYVAGNFGSYGYNTVTTPGLAKNAISVGAVDGKSPNARTSFSSMGPTNDSRIKPDLMAPGVSVISAKSSQAVNPCSQPATFTAYYCIMSGTSMATPNLAGLASLTQEYYKTYEHLTKPSAALVKATLIDSADDIGYGIPSREAGWGRVNISAALPVNRMDLSYIDAAQGLTTSQIRTYKIAVAAGSPLRVTLVYSDQPGTVFPFNVPQLVNDLDLVVTDPNGKKYNGNDVLAPFDDTHDRTNNVEHIFIQTPTPGTYTVEIRAYNVPLGTQDYAWVAHYNNAAGFACSTLSGKPC